jgi:multidrug efflux pump subunit AcrA (membrane-fusion protein)
MHPTFIADKPGTCPVCGMNLVQKARPGEEVKITEDLARLIKSPNEVVIGSIKTTRGEFKSMPVSVEAQGIVTYDTRNIFTIPARIGGRLERVYLKYLFQPVRKGQKVAEIYSPELTAAERELLYLVQNDPSDTSLFESAKNKLYLLGATQKQVEELIGRKDVHYTFSIYSPYDGYVIGARQQAPAITTTSSPSGMGGDMGGSPSGSASMISSGANNASTDLVREGDYVSPGQLLFKIVNASALRVELDLQFVQRGEVSVKDQVDLDLGNQRTEKGEVDFVQPFFTEGQEFVKVRVYLKNNGDLRIGQLVRATIRLNPVEALWIPREAVLDLGVDKVVFVKDREVFTPKNVKTGLQSDGWIQIIQRLSSSDEIASNAQFMVDSESFIKAK